jgi:hypothetical protein
VVAVSRLLEAKAASTHSCPKAQTDARTSRRARSAAKRPASTCACWTSSSGAGSGAEPPQMLLGAARAAATAPATTASTARVWASSSSAAPRRCQGAEPMELSQGRAVVRVVCSTEKDINSRADVGQAGHMRLGRVSSGRLDHYSLSHHLPDQPQDLAGSIRTQWIRASDILLRLVHILLLVDKLPGAQWG